MVMDLATLQQQLPQLEVCCERLYNAQVRERAAPQVAARTQAQLCQTTRRRVQDPGERTSAEQSLKPFTSSTEYAPHLKVRSGVEGSHGRKLDCHHGPASHDRRFMHPTTDGQACCALLPTCRALFLTW